MRTTKIRWIVFLVLALLGLVVRLVALGARPMHTDESVNAYIVGQILGGTPYHYDPQDRHGPALAEVAVPLMRLEGAKSFADLTESEVRLAPVLGGVIGILLFGAGVEAFGFIPCVVAALLFAFAPLSLYYSRYFIHETQFVVATWGLIIAGYRALQKNSVGSALLAGLCAAFMVACKETAVLNFAALAGAAALGQWWSNEAFTLKKNLPFRLWAPALAVFILAGLFLFTWYGLNWRAPLDLIRAIPNFTERAGGEGHQKPFYYYVHLLATGWSGPMLMILAGAGFWRCFQPGKAGETAVRRFIALYAGLIILIYSLIPYKTPWLALNFWLPLAVLIGLLVERFWLTLPQLSQRGWMVLMLAGIGGLIFHDDHKWVYKKPAGEKNPYAYAHTIEDVLGLPERIEQVCMEQKLKQPRIAVVAADPWPLPWYLRKFPQTGFWQPGQDPGRADFYVTSSDVPTNLNPLLKPYRYEFYGVRPNVLLLLWTPPPAQPPATP